MSLSFSSSSSSNSDSASDSNDPLQLTINIAIDIRDRLVEELESGESSIAASRPRKFIDRERDLAEERLLKDYFHENSTYQPYHFRRRFRMHKLLFLKIVRDVEATGDYFKQLSNARGILGFHPIQKCTAVIRMLAYSTHSDAIDESIRMSARVALECLLTFWDLVILMYGKRYMHEPSPNDIRQLYAYHAQVHGFPSMLRSLIAYIGDGMCVQTLDTVNTQRVITATQQSYFRLHPHRICGFGINSLVPPGSNNDINVLDSSDLYDKLYNETAPDSSFMLRGTEYQYGYYLVEGIYPEHSIPVKTLTCPNNLQRQRFKRAQERAMTDIERAFGVLKKRFQIVSKPSMFRKVNYDEGDAYMYHTT